MVSFWGCGGASAAEDLDQVASTIFQPLFEKFGPLAELIVVEQLTYEFFAWIWFAPGSRRIRREQGPRLEVDQQGREVDEVGAEIDIEFLGAT